MGGVINLMDKHTIIRLKQSGMSNRQIQKTTGINRKTVAKYWNEYQQNLQELESTEDIRKVQQRIVSAPSYDTSGRKPVKYTEQIDQLIDEILESEQEKTRILGTHKQHLTNVQIHQIILDAGYDIGISTVSMHVKEKRQRHKEVFIRQQYEPGQRVEYDFGEVKLVIGGKVGTYHMAVFGAPFAQHRWAYLYDNQKKEVFMDSHVRYFEMMGGVHKEIVYDNMKNVVSRFIGRNEKELNEDLLKMSIYYGYQINVTNCFSGNEKGYVEGSVKVVRKEAFAAKYEFDSLRQAQEHLHEVLEKLNKDGRIEEEKQHLLPYRPPLDLATVSRQKVDKYSTVRVENNFYSVPEHLCGHEVTVKTYLNEIAIYGACGIVCRHKKIDGFGEMQIDIMHYLDTFCKKPGALKNSKALKSNAHLKTIYDTHFTTRTREFIDILRRNADKDMEQLLDALKEAASHQIIYQSSDKKTMEDHINEKSREQMRRISMIYAAGGKRYVN